MSETGNIHSGLPYLLELNGEIFLMDQGYWTKFEARLVDATENIPHGIKYSLTLHDKNNRRIIGYDNAHGILSRKKPLQGVRIVWDHRHERNKAMPYQFESAGPLMEDFWQDVHNVIVAAKR